ncbi:MAG: fumarate hydratase [Acutalibacteraceae bacterium]|jgi:fumarate hydratase subunit alpha|nr:fumarate hydratase [Clostridiales bacterium]
MREIDVKEIKNAVKELCISANKVLPNDLESCIKNCVHNEIEELPKSIMQDISNNIDVAKELSIPICQDTGMAVVFAQIGQDVHIVGGDFVSAINEGVGAGYTEGLLRCSIVDDPLNRENTGDNTPAVIHTKIVEGDKIKLMVSPKGFGSENMSALKMFTPSATKQDIIDFISQTVENAASNPCPPIVLGVGIGGDFEHCAYLAKKALCRPISQRNEKAFYSDLELEILNRINELNIGPQGFGGNTTALAVNIEYAPTHIAGLPVAVNVGCHVTRHAEIIL